MRGSFARGTRARTLVPSRPVVDAIIEINRRKLLGAVPAAALASAVPAAVITKLSMSPVEVIHHHLDGLLEMIAATCPEGTRVTGCLASLEPGRRFFTVTARRSEWTANGQPFFTGSSTRDSLLPDWWEFHGGRPAGWLSARPLRAGLPHNKLSSSGPVLRGRLQRIVERSLARGRSPTMPSMAEEEMTLDHLAHVRLADAELTESNLLDATIYGPDDEEVGSVAHLHGTGAGAQVIVDVGGFLGIGAKPVALSLSQLDFMRDDNGNVHATTALTKDQVKALPEHHH